RQDRAEAAAPGIVVVSSAAEVFSGVDAVVIATEWPEFAALPYDDLRPLMRRPFLFDGRGLVNPAVATAAGLHYRGVGRRPRDPVEIEVS
ncbi:MAG: UDP binding domain-containing protein, partial [Candidatus Limnocylindrales bacterium]